MPDPFIYSSDDAPGMAGGLLEGNGASWWDEFFGLVCFRPEGGSGYTDQQVYERGSLGGGLGYSEERLCALWDKPPFSLRVLRPMNKTDGPGPWFGEDFLWALLASKR